MKNRVPQPGHGLFAVAPPFISHPPDRIRFGLLMTVLVAAFALGGTSGEPALRVMAIEVLAVLSLVVTLSTWGGGVPKAEHLAALIALFALPILQLTPLPPAIWTALPGRETATQTSALIGTLTWRSLTLDPEATFKALLALLIPAATFLGVMQASERERELIIWCVVGLGIASILLGLFQALISGGFYLFETAHRGLPLGFFGNRNHQAAFLYVCAVLMAGRLKGGSPYKLWIAGLLLLFTAGTFATSSRSGMVLVLLGLLVIALQYMRLLTWRYALLVCVVAAALFAAQFSSGSVVHRSIARFADINADYRYQFWPDIIIAAKAYFPAGAGLGTFVKSYQAFENLDIINKLYVNRAHNDYLQLLLEAGLLGALAPVAFLVWLGVCLWRLRSQRYTRVRQSAMNAALAIGLLMLHSLIDYPMRTYALMALFGVLCGLMVRPIDTVKAHLGKQPKAVDVSLRTLEGMSR